MSVYKIKDIPLGSKYLELVKLFETEWFSLFGELAFYNWFDIKIKKADEGLNITFIFNKDTIVEIYQNNDVLKVQIRKSNATRVVEVKFRLVDDEGNDLGPYLNIAESPDRITTEEANIVYICFAKLYTFYKDHQKDPVLV